MTTFETRAMLPTNLRPIEYAKAIQRKMSETWFYQRITRTPVNTGTVRTNISTATLVAPLVKPENTYSTVVATKLVIGGTYAIQTLGTTTIAQWITAGTTAATAATLVVGQSYIITALGSTTTAQWTAAGVVGTAVVGTIFTATANGVGTGTVLVQKFVAAANGVGTGTVFLFESASPTFSQSELTLATYQTSIVVGNELFDDAKNLMEFVTSSLADSMAEAIGGATLLAVRNGVLSGRVTNGASEDIAYPSELVRIGLTLSAGGSAFTQEQRARCCYVMHPSVLMNTLALTSLAGSEPVTISGIPFKAGVGGKADTIWGRDVYTSNAMLAVAGTAQAGATGAHILLADLSQVILYEQPLLVTVDRQTRLGSNQSVIYATQRAVGAMMNDLAIVSMNLHSV